MKIRLTERAIEKLTAPEAGSTITYDLEVRGFGVRTTSAGVKSFILNYSINKTERRLTIGRVSEVALATARAEAVALREKIRQGCDPILEKHQEQQALQATGTVAQLCHRYMSDYAPRKRDQGKKDKQMIDRFLLPNLSTLLVPQVNRGHIDQIHQSLRSTPYQANRVRALCSKLFELAAVDWQLRPDNPCRGIKKFPEHKRKIRLNLEQVGRLQTALDSYHNQQAAQALTLAAVTGSRPGEVAGAQWPQFDLEAGIWTKPMWLVKQGEATHEDERVQLNDDAMALLRRLVRTDSPLLFPGTRRKYPQHSTKWLWGHWRKISRAAGLMTAEGEPFPLYILRHSFGSALGDMGESLEKIGALMGHRNPNTTKRYVRIDDAPLRATANGFSAVWAAARAHQLQPITQADLAAALRDPEPRRIREE